MLVERDSLAFANQDWDMVKDDFVVDHFMGIHGNFKEFHEFSMKRFHEFPMKFP